MHACWDFDESSARTQRVSALDKYKIEAQVHYFVTILEHKVNTQLLIKLADALASIGPPLL